jgi:hypothetical protein
MMDRWPGWHCFDAGNKKLPIPRPLLLVRLPPLSAMRTIDSSGLRKWTPCAGDLSFGNPKSSLHTPPVSRLLCPRLFIKQEGAPFLIRTDLLGTLVCVSQVVAVISIAPIQNQPRMPFPLYGNVARCGKFQLPEEVPHCSLTELI